MLCPFSVYCIRRYMIFMSHHGDVNFEYLVMMVSASLSYSLLEGWGEERYWICMRFLIIVLSASFITDWWFMHAVIITVVFFKWWFSVSIIPVMPGVRVPKIERIRRPQQCKSIKGFITSSSQDPCFIQHSGIRQRPRALNHICFYTDGSLFL